MSPVTDIDSRIKPGDIVQLKSGGPRMTVVRITRHAQHKDLQAECYWWSSGVQAWGYSVIRTSVPWGKDFPLAGLKKVTMRSKPKSK